jgi:hypothetical protein
MRMRLFGITLLTALAAVAVLAAPSQARDRNHDRIGDKWEKKHHLSLRVNQARKDQDRDGLKNRGEFRAQTDPRDDDSDNDGIEDGDEQAGKVASYDTSNGTLVVELFGGGTITGKVTSATDVECDTSGDDDGDGSGDDDHSERSLRGSGDDDEGDDDHGDSHGGDDESDNESCPPDTLKQGAIVQEAELKLVNGAAFFEKIELVG